MTTGETPGAAPGAAIVPSGETASLRMRVHGHRAWPLALMVGSGGLLAAQARVNGELQHRLGGGAAVSVLVALVSFAVGTVVVVTVLLAAPRARRAARALPRAGDTLRWWFFVGGVGGAALVSVSAAAVPVIGVALLSVCTVAGQTTGSLVVDEVGLGPGGRRPITGHRLAGAAIAVGALLLATVGRGHGEFSFTLVLAISVAGVLVAGQQAVNGRLAVATGEPRLAAVVSFVGGTLVLAVLTAVIAGAGALPTVHWPGAVWLYLGGVGGAVYISLGAATVARIGVLALSLASVAGQLLGSVVLDALAPAPGERLSAATVVGVALTFVAVAVTARSPAPGRHP